MWGVGIGADRGVKAPQWALGARRPSRPPPLTRQCWAVVRCACFSRSRMEETAALMEEPGYGLPLLGNNGTVFRAEQLTDEAVTLCAFPHVIRRTVRARARVPLVPRKQRGRAAYRTL